MTTATPTAPIEDARRILAAAGIDTAEDADVRAAVRDYRAAAPALRAVTTIPLRVSGAHTTTGILARSVTVDAWQAKTAGPILDRLAAAADAMRAAGWGVVRLSPDRFRADPADTVAALVAADQASRVTRASVRLDELADDLAALVAVLPVGGTQHRRASTALAALRD